MFVILAIRNFNNWMINMWHEVLRIRSIKNYSLNLNEKYEFSKYSHSFDVVSLPLSIWRQWWLCWRCVCWGCRPCAAPRRTRCADPPLGGHTYILCNLHTKIFPWAITKPAHFFVINMICDLPFLIDDLAVHEVLLHLVHLDRGLQQVLRRAIGAQLVNCRIRRTDKIKGWDRFAPWNTYSYRLLNNMSHLHS